MGGWPQNKHHVVPGIWRLVLSTALALPSLADPGCQAALLQPGTAKVATLPVHSQKRRGEASIQGLTRSQVCWWWWWAASPVRTGPEQLCFCAGGHLGAAHSGSDQPGHGRWVKSAHIRDPWAKGVFMEEVQSQLDEVQMLCDLGATLNQPLYLLLENGCNTYFSDFSLDYVQQYIPAPAESLGGTTCSKITGYRSHEWSWDFRQGYPHFSVSSETEISQSFELSV